MSDDDPTVIGSPQPPWPSGGNAPGRALPAGTRVQEFEIEGLVGEGGFSVVYRAHDTLLGRTIALKEYMPVSLAQRSDGIRVMPRTERQRATFELGLRSFVNEARLLASFDHPALVKVYRFWEDNGTAYLVMPLYQGPTLREWLAREGGRAPDEGQLLQMLHPLLDALEVMHAQQCYHRDIAPDNILLIDENDPRQKLPGMRPVLLDFGAARRVIGGATHALTVILKPGYAPIEQYAETPQARQGPWTDIYALCATLYDAVTGRVPEPSVGRLMHDGLEPAAVAAEGLFSPALLAAIDRGMAVKPQDRPQGVAGLRALLPDVEGRAPQTPADGIGGAAFGDGDATVILDPAQAAAVFQAARAAGEPRNQTAPRAADFASVDARASVPRHAAVQVAAPSARGGAARLHGGAAASQGAAGLSPATASAPQGRDRSAVAGQASSSALRLVVVPLAALSLAALAWWWAAGSGSGTGDTTKPAGSAAPRPVSTSADTAQTTAQAPPTTSPPAASSGQTQVAAPPASTSAVDPSPPARITPPARPPFSVLAALQDIAAGADPAIDVQVKATKPRLVIGRDNLGFSVRSAQPGHVYVFASGTDQAHFHLLFPNARDRSNRIGAGRTLQLPRESWPLESAGPPGVNHLLIVVSRSPRSFDGTGLVTKGQEIPMFDLTEAAARWTAATTGDPNPFIGRTACNPGAACAEGYGAGFVQVEEVAR